MRQLSLGDGVDTEHIAATYQNGVLTVTLPIVAKAKPRRIEITPGAGGETKIIEPADTTDQSATS
ncbi:hypothetical protein GCM10023094_00170 [Rhodococcus olei]|uniref:SHSP domain-containing protein n=1 Tax=Rhodococcus olei TaxID=2161675 RepID=A0ABP8NSR0_9NOCA